MARRRHTPAREALILLCHTPASWRRVEGGAGRLRLLPLFRWCRQPRQTCGRLPRALLFAWRQQRLVHDRLRRASLSSAPAAAVGLIACGRTAAHSGAGSVRKIPPTMSDRLNIRLSFRFPTPVMPISKPAGRRRAPLASDALSKG